ncbi:MAG: DUF222 domain-containing protein, partial [Kineosporiaceae bacterium]
MDQEQSPHRDGAAAGPSAAPTPELLASLDRIGAEVAVLQRASTLSLSDAEHGRALTDVYRMRARLEAAYLHLLRTFDTRPDAVPGVAARTVAATHLIHACHLDPVHARRDVSAAHAVDPDGSGVIPDTAEKAPPSSSGLPRVGAALAAGATSRAHLDAAARCLKGIPAHLLNEVDSDGWSGAARVDAYLAEQATRLSARDVARLGDHLLAMLDPDGQDSFDPDAHTRRELTYHTDATGMLVGRFALDPASGSLVRAAISALVKSGMTQPDPGEAPDSHHEDGQPVQPLLPLPDDRTPAQRRADAFTDLALRYLHGDSGTGSAEDGAAQEGAAQDGAAQEGAARDGAAQDGAAQDGAARDGAAQVIRPARRHRPPTTHVHVWATAAQIAAARAAQPAALDADGHPIQPPGTTFRRPACGLPGPTAPG